MESNNKLFVGNLPWATTEEDLEGLFNQVGKVEEVAVMRDRFSGRARGFAFVTMSSEAEANDAAAKFEGHDFMGRPLKVNVARPKEDRPAYESRGPRQSGGGFGGGRNFGGGSSGGRSFGGGGRSGGFGGGGRREGGGRSDRGGY
jgi:cold-inducible RNA-binding protein